MEDPPDSGAHAIPLQDIQAPRPAQRVISLVQVQEYYIQDLLPQGHQLLNHIGLGGGSTYDATRPKSVEEVVEGDGFCEPSI